MADIVSFIDYLKYEKRFSEHTISAYQTDLIQFTDFIQETFHEEILKANHHQVRSWVVSLKKDGNSHKTIHRKVSSLKSFYKFNLRLGIIDSSPTASIKLPKIEKRIPNFVKHSELSILKDDLFQERHSFKEVRDDLIILLLLATGIRRTELIHLKASDLSSSGIKVLGKRNKERIVPVPDSVRDRINEYLKIKEQEFEMPCDFLIVTNKGEKLYEKFVYGIVNNYLALRTTASKKSPHVLRHSYATELLNNGANLSSIKELLGHTSLAATQVYTHSSLEKIKEIYKSAHPRSIKK
jgi:integrase/recombinase XerC